MAYRNGWRHGAREFVVIARNENPEAGCESVLEENGPSFCPRLQVTSNPARHRAFPAIYKRLKSSDVTDIMSP